MQPQAVNDSPISTDLFVEIARCSNVAACLNTSNIDHPCKQIVDSQNALTLSEFRVPEPWCGHIETAPILFISSNPSTSEQDTAPKAGMSNEEIVDHFINRFDDRPVMHVTDKEYRSIPFWAQIRNRAGELLERPARQGIDFALTEVVHCKSRSETGVRLAVDECSQRYIRRIIESSVAKVLVVLGSIAEPVVRREFALSNDLLCGPIGIGGVDRIIAFLPHTNARQKRTFQTCFTPEQLDRVRKFLSD